MSLSASQVWEVRTTGNDTNGGAYKAGSTGADFSQQDTPQIAVTDVVATGGSTVTSASANFGPAHVGNVVYMAGGSGSLAPSRYEVVGVTNATTISLDRIVPAGSGITLNLGGAIASLTELASSRGMVASNAAFVKAGAGYTQTSTPVFSVGSDATTTLPFTRLIGYATTRGDNGQVNITLSTNAGLTAIKATASSWIIANFNINCASLATSTGILSYYHTQIVNCKVSNATAYGINANQYNVILNCEVTGCTTSAAVSLASSCRMSGCWIHDCVSTGIVINTSNARIEHSIVSSITGAASDGISFASPSGVAIVNNTICSIGRHGINNTGVTMVPPLIRGNILAKCGGYGLVMGLSAGAAAQAQFDGNAYWSNTLGNRNNADDISVNPQNGVVPYTNVYDVILSADPFAARASNDFALNNEGGGGAACRVAGLPRAWPGLAIAGYADMGAVQHQDAGGGVNVFFLEG